MGAAQSKLNEKHIKNRLAARISALELDSQQRNAYLESKSLDDSVAIGEKSADFKLNDEIVKVQLLARVKALELDIRQRDAYLETKSTNDGDSPPRYEEPAQGVAIDTVESWEKQLLSDSKNRLALAAFTTNAARSIISSRAATIADTQTFNIQIPLEGSPVTNQRSSGRCWLFASTNVFRVALMKKYNLKEFELSQSYLFYWDKLEKANYFLESVLDTLDEPLDGRLMQSLLAAPVNDGGQWDMVANLVSKYGLCPQVCYPDSFNAMSSSVMDGLLTTKLREDALRLRAIASSAKDGAKKDLLKQSMLREIHGILTLMLGPPPSPNKPFTWQYTDSAGEFQQVTTTPLDFASQLSNKEVIRAMGGTDVHQLFSLVHDPRNEFETLLTVDRLGNVYAGRPITYVNVKMTTLKQACISTLRKGIPIFFGSDVGKYSDSTKGIMDTSLYDYELGFNVKLGMSKAERLMTGESAMTHAMVLTGVHLEKDEEGEMVDVRWRVENSWSEGAGTKGYFVMTGRWFEEFVYQAVVDPSVVGREVRDVLGKKAKVLPHWDPMGALA